MFLEERQEAIIEMLARKGKVEVSELSKEFKVTDDCIRKDLSALERRGKLKRVYGGAVCLKESLLVETKKTNKRYIKADQKATERIAKAAVEMIHDGDMVFLDISASSLAIAEKLVLMEKNVTVVTNMIDVLVAVARCPKIRVVFVGGKINPNRDGFWGGLATEFTSKLKPDIAFVGAVGINVKENSVFTHNIDDGVSKAAIIKNSKRAYVVAEAKKIATDDDHSYNYTTLDTLSGVVIDTMPPKDIQESLESYGVEIILPEWNPPQR